MAPHVSDRIWELIKEGEFEAAIKLGEARFAERDADAWQVLPNLAQAYLAERRYTDAYRCYTQVDELRQRSGPPGTRYLDHMARAAWLIGDGPKALEYAKLDVSLLSTGQTFMADFAGGVSNALFLYYCSVTVADTDGRAQACAFIEKCSKNNRRFRSWPGPLGGYVLGATSFEAVLMAASKHSSLSESLAFAGRDVLARRQMVEALFYAAARSRDTGDEEGCLTLMRRCAELENPRLELEWYIAELEVKLGGIATGHRT